MSGWTPGTKERFSKKVLRFADSDCWLFQGTRSRKGYGQFWDRGTMRQAHRVAWEIYVGPIPEGMFVLHRCDIPPCVNPAHLFLGTNADNMADMKNKHRGRSLAGTHNGNAHISAEDVRRIRSAYARGLRSHRQLGEWFGINASWVGSIVRGEGRVNG